VFAEYPSHATTGRDRVEPQEPRRPRLVNDTDRGGSIVNALVLLCAINFVIIVLAAVTLVVVGLFTPNRLEVMLKLFTAEMDDERKALVLETLAGKLPVEEKVPPELTELQRQYEKAGGVEKFFRQLERDIERRRESIRPELVQLAEAEKLHEETLAEIETQRQALAAERRAFDADVQAWRDKAESAAFLDNIARLEKMEPTDVADILLVWEETEALRYLAALTPKFAAEVLTEMKTKDETVARLVALLGKGEPAASLGPQKEKSTEER